MQTDIQINKRQTENLKAIIKAGKLPYEDPAIDRRSIKALEKRGLVKFAEQKKGVFVLPTAKGKKHLN